MTASQAKWHGKRDQYAKAVGGFALAYMSDGGYDYFPAGQPPQKNGEVDKGARITEKWSFVAGYGWKQIA